MFNAIAVILAVLTQILNIGAFNFAVTGKPTKPIKVIDYQTNQVNPGKLLDYGFSFSNKPFSIIVSHHLFARHLIGSTFKAVNFQPDRVIILGPNHFYRGKRSILFSNADWTIQGKTIKSDRKIIDYMASLKIGEIDNSVFEKEHSIYTTLPFIKYYFPKAKIVPIILKYQTSDNETKRLAQILSKIIDDNSLVVVSTDFSHQVLPKIAAKQDAKSIEILANSDITKVDQMEVDSRPSIKTLLYLQKIKGVNQFQLLKNTNSGYLGGNPKLSDTTSYIFSGYLR